MNRIVSSVAMVSVSAAIAWAVVAPAGQFEFLGGAAAATSPSVSTTIVIDRTLKGDRLAPQVMPIMKSTPDRAPVAGKAAPATSKKIDAKMLEGCEPAASPIASPELAHIVGSCLS